MRKRRRNNGSPPNSDPQSYCSIPLTSDSRYAPIITQVIESRINDSEIRRLQYPYKQRRGLHTFAQNGLGLLRPVRACRQETGAEANSAAGYELGKNMAVQETDPKVLKTRLGRRVWRLEKWITECTLYITANRNISTHRVCFSSLHLNATFSLTLISHYCPSYLKLTHKRKNKPV